MSGEMDDLSAAESKATEAERAAAKVDEAIAVPESGAFFRPSTRALPQQSEFNRAVVTALLELVRSCQDVLGEQRARTARVEQAAGAVLSMGERLHEMQRRIVELETRLDEDLPRTKAGEENVRQLIEASRHEMRERIRALLDEQRVSLRQLSLQTSEDAVLSDRARRATELRLEEIARRIEQLAQTAAA